MDEGPMNFMGEPAFLVEPPKETLMPISVTQNSDGSLMLAGALSVTIKQVSGGMSITANDTLVLPVDRGPALQAKIDLAKADLAKVSTDVAKVGADLA